MSPGDRSDTPPLALAFGASDPSGAEGVQCDLLTLAGLGVHPLSVMTAIVVRDTAAAESILVIDAEWVEDQCRALLEDMRIGAFKVGSQVSVETVAVIAEVIADYPDVPLIVHPQFFAADAAGVALELADATRDLLLPQTDLLVVSLPDAAWLVESVVDDAAEASAGDADEIGAVAGEPAAVARLLLAAGARGVMLTGLDDGAGGVESRVYREDEAPMHLPWAPIAGGAQRGAADTVSAAVTGLVARGESWPDAIRAAHVVAWQAAARSFHPGMGARLPDRLFAGDLPGHRPYV